MAYDEELADRLRLLLGSHGLTEQKMFGGLAFLRDGHLAVCVSGQGGLMVRTDPADAEALLAQPGVQPMQMQGRTMKGWLRVDAAAVDDDAALRRWAERGLAFAGSLPPK